MNSQKSARLPVNIFKKKCPWTYENCPWTSKFCVFLLLFLKKCPWTAKSAREHFQKSVRERTLKCPWKRPKKCPWTHPPTRELSLKSAREPKKVPVNIVQKMWFTGTFDVHGKKKNTGSAVVGLSFWCSTRFTRKKCLSQWRETCRLHSYICGYVVFGQPLKKVLGKYS